MGNGLESHSGILIRKARQQQGLSQNELAVAADVSRRTVQNVEAGKPGVKRSSVNAIAEAVGVDLGEEFELQELPQVGNSESFTYWPFGLFKFVKAKLKPNRIAFCETEREILTELETMWQNFQSGLQACPQEIQTRFQQFHPDFLTKAGYFDRYFSIWRANPLALSFSSSRGVRTGVSIALPVSENTYSDFLNGNLSSFDIAGTQILKRSPLCIFDSLATYANFGEARHSPTNALSFIAFHQLAVLTAGAKPGSVRVAAFAAIKEKVDRMRRAGLTATSARMPGLDFPVWELAAPNRHETTDDQIRSSTLQHFLQLRRNATQYLRAKVTLKSLAAYRVLIQSNSANSKRHAA